MANTLGPLSPCKDIHAFLESQKDALPGWYIHPKVVSYRNQAARKQELKRIGQSKLNEESINFLLEDYSLPDTLGNMEKKMVGGGNIFWMCGQMRSGDELKQKKASAWHSFLVLYKDHNLIFVDPAYGPGIEEEGGKKMRYTQMGGGLFLGIRLVENLRKSKRHRVDNMWLGKGLPQEEEYDDINCNTLVQKYLVSFISSGGKIGGYKENGFEEMSG